MKNKNEFIKLARIIAIILLLLVLLRGTAMMIVLFLATVVLSFFIQKAGNPVLRKIGMEFVTFTAVLSGKAYGWKIGFIVGFILISYHLFATGYFGNYVLWVIPSYAVAGALAGVIGGNIVTQGIYSAVGIQIVSTIFTLIFNMRNIGNYMVHAVSNIIFNVVLFSLLGTPIYLLIS